jgi:hypothetical protein
VRRGRALKLIDTDEVTGVGLDARAGEVQAGGVGRPPDGRHGERRLRLFPPAVFGEVHPHAGRRLLEGLDNPEGFPHLDAGLAEGGRHRGRDLFVFGRQNARPRVEEPGSRAEGVEDRGHLRPRGPAADHD